MLLPPLFPKLCTHVLLHAHPTLQNRKVFFIFRVRGGIKREETEARKTCRGDVVERKK